MYTDLVTTNTFGQYSEFVHRLCEKHEPVLVTQTTTSCNTNVDSAKIVSWYQCKHCGKLM